MEESNFSLRTLTEVYLKNDNLLEVVLINSDFKITP